MGDRTSIQEKGRNAGMPRLSLHGRAVLKRTVTHGNVIVAAGEKGIIADIDPECGDILFRPDRFHSELAHWHNLMPIAHNNTDALKSDGMFANLYARSYCAPIGFIGAVTACMVSFMIGWFFEPPLATAEKPAIPAVVSPPRVCLPPGAGAGDFELPSPLENLQESFNV
jgi:hypothetical protein